MSLAIKMRLINKIGSYSEQRSSRAAKATLQDVPPKPSGGLAGRTRPRRGAAQCGARAGAQDVFTYSLSITIQWKAINVWPLNKDCIHKTFINGPLSEPLRSTHATKNKHGFSFNRKKKSTAFCYSVCDEYFHTSGKFYSSKFHYSISKMYFVFVHC